jgi:hypothetical protein
MELVTETFDSPLKVLIVSAKHEEFVTRLKKKMDAFQVEVVPRIHPKLDFSQYNVCFFIDTNQVLPTEFMDDKDKKIVFLFFNNERLAQNYSSYAYQHKLNFIKVIHLQSIPEFYEKDVETILWFAFSRTEDIYLHLYHHDLKKRYKPVKKHFDFKTYNWKSLLKPKTLLLFGFLCILFTHLLFIPPLIASSILHYTAGKQILQNDDVEGLKTLNTARSALSLAEALYRVPAPIFRFFSVALPIDNTFGLNESVHEALQTTVILKKDAVEFGKLLSIKDKTPVEASSFYSLKDKILKNTDVLYGDVMFLKEKMPTWNADLISIKDRLGTISTNLQVVKDLEPYFDTIFAKDTEKKYLLLFANNMELRPGGGFIGSFAVLHVADYTITDLKVYDVYDADGQLDEQIDPPAPLVKYLNQTHWFLRDSAFSPDFIDNLGEAQKFLELELNETAFDGGIMITTTAVQNLLDAMGSVYIPDYKESITKDNFYIKTQLYAEDGFFPGSTQKKRFLSAVLNSMIQNLYQASLPHLFEMTEKSLNEKQIVLYMDEPKLQDYLEKNYWSGRTLTPKCSMSESINCVLDFAFPYDANLGVNKANYFVKRPTRLKVEVTPNGKIQNTLTIAYSNNSYADVFPGGIYKNYFQLLLPPNSNIQRIMVNGKIITEFDETNFEYKTVGFLTTVKPQETSTIEILYNLPTTIISGDGVYQLIYQKQIGSPNYDFQFEFSFPDNFTIRNKNFSPLVKDNKMLYNTSISHDKIFVIEFSKK